ncbi:hypothetical protein MTP99_006746 [Tenebrio molitor]|nr:hypothetical protein MTP99_006746 [Tenebrio molitor]
MVFGLLRLEICERFTFSSTDSFLKLLTAVRGIEASLRKKQNEPTQETEKKNPCEKCTFCKNPGHDGDVSICRKKIRAE